MGTLIDVHVIKAAVVLVPALLAGAGVLYCALCLWAARSFLRLRRATPEGEFAHVPLSILKPVSGMEPGLAEALRSHLAQSYDARVELLFAVSSMNDPAVPMLRALAAEFPTMRIEVIHTPLVLGTNRKMSNLAQLLPHAKYEHVLISDADIRVGPFYLRRMVLPFLEAETGLVTALYRGRTHPLQRPTLGSRLEALGISTDFAPGVLAARLTEGGLRFGLGSTLLVTRKALAAAGGLEALTNVLADDHELGRRVAEAGFKVVLSPEPVSTAAPAYAFTAYWEHQIRWARTVRDARPWSYVGLVFTQPIPWALLLVVASAGSQFSILLLLLAVLARMAVALRVGYGIVGDAQVLRDLALLPVRDCVGWALWVWSFAGTTVVWRGERFRVEKGRLLRVADMNRAPAPVRQPGIE